MDGEVSACDAAAMAAPAGDPRGQSELGAPSDKDEFSAWVRPHLVAMRRLAARTAPGADIDDVVQDALGRAWKRRSTFDPARGSPKSWLLAVVADQARKARARADRRRRLVVRDRPQLPPVEGRDLDLERSIDSLTPRQREVVDLHYFVDLTVSETAELLGISEGTVKSTLSDARARLRDLMAQEGGEDV